MARDHHPGVWQIQKDVLSLLCQHHSTKAKAATTTTTTTTTRILTAKFYHTYSKKEKLNRTLCLSACTQKAQSQAVVMCILFGNFYYQTLHQEKQIGEVIRRIHSEILTG
jgi:hypothetical protein